MSVVAITSDGAAPVMRCPQGRMVNALTIDVEDYFQVSAFAPYIPRNAWDTQEMRVERNMDVILRMLDDHRTRATFFTLGWIAERLPGLVRRIVEAGHELASHGYGHHRATEQSREAFLSDIKLAKVLLEDVTGVAVKGYRAPSFSIGTHNLWAFDCIEQAGYAYTSSVYPIRHDHYGMPDGPRFPYRVGDRLMELPVTTARLFDRNWPAAGGGYFRLLPYPMSRWLLRRVNRVDRAPAIFYFHPWEIDAGQPRVAGIDRKTRFRHYINIPRMERRLRRLLCDFAWDRADRVFLTTRRADLDLPAAVAAFAA
jgi:polysaccharide deacetylase family protein (PEP-CTERM system associated)